MATECPVSFEKVDETAARGIGFVVVAGVALFLFAPVKWIAALLAIDFFLRAFVSPRSSPVAASVRFVTRALGLKPRPIDAAPKKFAAGLGFAFSVSALALWLAGLWTAASVVAMALGTCALLEGAFGYCVGCQVYTLVKPLLPGRDRAVPATLRR